MDRETYLADRLRTLAVEKLFINLGEAARRVDESVCTGLPEVPWRQIIGLRNVLAHGYAEIEQETLWVTARQDLFAVQVALERALGSAG